ncbi:MAG: stage III sporulation protein AA [Clostridia bacterium]|nr:stage III sporulation protein AA [Clostridia bacterium]
MKEILKILPGELRRIISQLPTSSLNLLAEIRLRSERPLMVNLIQQDAFLTREGSIISDPADAYRVTGEDMLKTIQLMSNSSVYALEEELRNGFLTLPGGHRVGLVGKVNLSEGRIKTISHIGGLNIRVARQFPGTADKVLPFIIEKETNRLYHTLILSPPCCGKTTLLRDVVRQVSNGIPALGFLGVTVGVVDERSEIAGCYKGVPQLDVGLRTDVLDACPKAQGMILLIRSMAPEVLAVDEIGRMEDIQALEEALNAGIRVLATIHGSSIEDLNRRPALDYLLKQGIFQRFVVLGKGVTLKEIINGQDQQPLMRGESNVKTDWGRPGDNGLRIGRLHGSR